ncbi:MAG TPA: glycosyltransferase family 2 protein [Anaerolineae bacterium]|nr:glycosyltransferase family 2 protein [Anaerolineae bacterium]
MTKDEGRTTDNEHNTRYAIRDTLAAVVLTRNEERHIGPCLDSLAWAGRRVVFDSFSTDGTCDLAREHGADVIQHPFTDYAAQRNAALEAVEAEWIFFVDADERATPELGEEISRITYSVSRVTGWYVPRENYLFGKRTRGAGYWPDYQMRLLRRGMAHYERPASEIVALAGEAGYLKHPLIHYNYESVAQFHAKQTFRIDFEASNLYQQGIKPKFYTPYSQYARHFWWRFVTLGGWCEGWHGLRLSLLLAYYFGYRYFVRLAEMWREAA